MINILIRLATAIEPGQLPTGNKGSSAQIQDIINIAFETLGALALLMIVVSGLRYVLSAGNEEKAKRAKEGIVYSLVGLAIAIAARAIVTFIGTNV